MDPYLEKRRRQEAKILQQIKAALAKQGQGPPQLPKPTESQDYSGYVFHPGPGGILLPDDMGDMGDMGAAIFGSETTGWATTNVDPQPLSEIMETYLKKKLAAKQAELTAEIFHGFPVAVGNSWPGSVSHTRACEQQILRDINGRRYEYVWSETLQAHVRIGESLKEKTNG